jgi:predicted AlkP superfamily pyrophosphatase or phosphodiesterase
MLRQAIRDSGAEDATNLVITADHGQLDCLRQVSPNVLLAQNGLIETDEQGSVTDWKALSLSAGMCATVYVKDSADEPRVRAVLEKCIGNGVSRIYSREEAAAEGYAGDFAFVLETDDVTYFKNNWIGAYQSDYDAPKGNHGYHPDKGSRPFMLCHGPAFCEGAALPEAHLVDGAPTWAQALGIDLPDTDGRVLFELLKK